MLKVYVGYDPRDEMAARACVASLLAHSSIELDIILLRENEVRAAGCFWRGYFVEGNGQMIDNRDGKPFSTQFSFTRFAVPLIDGGDEWVLFCDADMLFMSDVAHLLALADESKAVMCVKHDHRPAEQIKMDGVLQTRYARKNWSSFMLLKPSRCTITPYQLNNETGTFLHGLLWQRDEEIGGLPESWNWLEGWSSPNVRPDVVHYTRGTPDMLIGANMLYEQEWWQAVNEWRPWMNRSLKWKAPCKSEC